MSFDFILMLRLACKALFAGSKTNARLTAKRIKIIIVLFPAYIVVEAMNWLGFFLDDIFFRRYRNVEIREPLFIVGNPRSGTTFIHRLLAKDSKLFTSMKLWEIFFAPSIIQKKFWVNIGKLDRWIGSPVANFVLLIEKRWLGKLGKMHHLSLFEPEEDELILFHIFSSVYLIIIFPFQEDLRPFMRFDEELPEKRRKRVMAFYKRCVQCHLFVFGENLHFLSKNPLFSPKVKSIVETFQDARIICMVRTPLDVLPSMNSIFAYYYNIFTSPVETYPMRDFIFETISHWYNHPAQVLDKLAVDHQAVVKYTAMIQRPNHTILGLYERFGLNITPEFRQILYKHTKKAGLYKSKHSYSIKQTGFSQKEVLDGYSSVFERYGFDLPENTTST